MGAVADSAVLTWFLGIAIAVNGIVATVYAHYYIEQFLDDPPLQGDSTTVYYNAVYVRGLGVFTALLALIYVGWVYFDSRHTFEPGKRPGAGGFSFGRLQRSRLHATYGVDVEKIEDANEKKKVMAAHRGKLTGLAVVLFVMWFIPAILFFAKGWLYKYQKNKEYEKQTEGTVCTYNRDTETCRKVEEVGIATMFELLWLFLYLIVCIVGQQSKGVEVDAVYKRLKATAEKNDKEAKDKKKALEDEAAKSKKLADDLKLFQGQLSQSTVWKPGDDLPFPKDGKPKEAPKPPEKKMPKHWTMQQVRGLPTSPSVVVRHGLSPGSRAPFMGGRSPLSPLFPGSPLSPSRASHHSHHSHGRNGSSHSHMHGHSHNHGHGHGHGHSQSHGSGHNHGHSHDHGLLRSPHSHSHSHKHHHHHKK